MQNQIFQISVMQMLAFGLLRISLQWNFLHAFSHIVCRTIVLPYDCISRNNSQGIPGGISRCISGGISKGISIRISKRISRDNSKGNPGGISEGNSKG